MTKAFISLSKIQPAITECYAHKKGDQPKESVLEHTELCQKYYRRVVEKRGIKPVFRRFEELYLPGVSEEALGLFAMMRDNIVSFHDVGKMNPLFQEKKMDHRWKKENAPSGNLGSKHSIISSVVYLNYFLGEIKRLEIRRERELMKDMVCVHAYIIAKHHGTLGQFWDYLKSFDENWGENLGWHAGDWLMEWESKVNGREVKVPLSGETKYIEKRLAATEEDTKIFLYIYMRLMHSLLVASDYYATSQYMSGVEVKSFGEVSGLSHIYEEYSKTEIISKIRKYEQYTYPMAVDQLKQETNINVLRTEIFLEAEKVLKAHEEASIFYLEAPTGSGKSNTAMNLSLQLLKSNDSLKKIFYIYPFNTLVEQNMESLAEIFDGKEEIMSQIAVVNSLVPLKENEEEYELEQRQRYQKILLDRQFLNYPIVLSTHAALFRTMFGSDKEALFGFHQLCNSVIVLDEIQSYRNEIWSEIIRFLKGYAKLLNIKVIIMSATLPNLEVLAESREGVVYLMQNRERYFTHRLFCHRVHPDYHLLEEKITLDMLAEDVLLRAGEGKKVLIELIKKESAYELYEMLSEIGDNEVLLMTGDSSILERKRIIQKLKGLNTVILVATQVIEAGVDIDMDIGYKDISKLDSEEQFMGRINRSCKRSGIVYFFDLDPTGGIYRNDFRSFPEYTLLNEEMREILSSKNYERYYLQILECLKRQGKEYNDNNLNEFFKEKVGFLDFPGVEKRMQLIENRQMISIYLARELEAEEGTLIDGRKIWRSYVNLLTDNEMEYAQKSVELFRVRSVMNNFIYQINKGKQFSYTEQIGDIYYIEDGEDYFENGILNRKMLGEEYELFI